MNYPVKMYMFCLIAVSMHHHTNAETLFKKISNFFAKEPHVEIVQRSFALPASGILRIDNRRGNIYIKTEWNQESIFLTAQKHTPTIEQLTKISIKDTRTAKGELCIETVYANETIKGSVDYVLIVPAKTNLHLHTHEGSIKIKKTQGPIVAQTTSGNITIYSAGQQVTAHVEHKGAITIHNAYGAVNAITNRGNITLNNTHSSVHAFCSKGNISMQASKIPSTSSIDLATHSGNVQLLTPKNLHADIKAKTDKGTLTSNHHITIKPFTTQLDSDSFKRIKHEINGTIGTGEALIALNTHKGSIKLTRDC